MKSLITFVSAALAPAQGGLPRPVAGNPLPHKAGERPASVFAAVSATVFAALVVGLSSAPVSAAEAGDAVFADRAPWSVPEGGLHWALTVQGPQAPGFLPVSDGDVVMSTTIDPADGKTMLQLIETTGTRDRTIGPFPTDGGDPVLTFFLEQTSRDMAALTGGSPFYIRNRMKDALFRGGEIAERDGARVAVFRPFADDPNAEKMRGFETLTLQFTMDDPKAPIRELRAETEGAAPGYLTSLVLE